MKSLVALRHLAFEDLGLIDPWLRRRGWHVRYHDVGVEPLAEAHLDQADVVAVLGGPIAATDEARYPYLRDEVQQIADRLARGRPVLGICLGAQLMARALGARVAPMATREIGFGPLALTALGERSPLRHLRGQPVLHWHGDAFDVPDGARRLASTLACPHQAFMVGDHGMAWQFHLEVDMARIEAWLIGHGEELQRAGISLADLREAAARHRAGLAAALDAVLSDWFHRLGLADPAPGGAPDPA